MTDAASIVAAIYGAGMLTVALIVARPRLPLEPKEAIGVALIASAWPVAAVVCGARFALECIDEVTGD